MNVFSYSSAYSVVISSAYSFLGVDRRQLPEQEKYRKIPKISPSVYKHPPPPKYKPPKPRNAKKLFVKSPLQI